jgi:hypothetical protein
MNTQDKIKMVTIFIVAFLLLLLAVTVRSQSIMINNDGRPMITFSEEEKAVKISSSLIKAKEDNRWETHINNVKVMWEIKYRKDTKMYLLYKNHVKYYESSTISGIRSKYGSDLLGRNIVVQ